MRTRGHLGVSRTSRTVPPNKPFFLPGPLPFSQKEAAMYPTPEQCPRFCRGHSIPSSGWNLRCIPTRFYYWVPHKPLPNQRILLTKRDKDSSTHSLSKLPCAPVDQGASKTQPSPLSNQQAGRWSLGSGNNYRSRGWCQGRGFLGVGKQLSVSFHSRTEQRRGKG